MHVYYLFRNFFVLLLGATLNQCLIYLIREAEKDRDRARDREQEEINIQMSTFVRRSNNNSKVPSICPSTWREVNGFVLFFLMLPSCFTSSPPLSVSLLQLLSLLSYPDLNEWKEKSPETRLVSSCSAHST